jgi:hypothetical protein
MTNESALKRRPARRLLSEFGRNATFGSRAACRHLCVCAAALLSVSLFWFSPALAEDRERPKAAGPMDLVRNCPAGHRLEFVLPAVTLYLDVHWLGDFTIIDLFHAYGTRCPEGPVKVGRDEKVTRLAFAPSAVRQLNLESGLGIGGGVFRLYARGNPELPGRPRMRKGDNPTGHTEPWVEDHTHEMSPGFLAKDPEFRIYLLHYPGPSSGLEYVNKVVCGSGRGYRECSTSNLQDGSTVHTAFYLSYHLPQNKLPVPPVSPVYSMDPAMEPGALLQFGDRFRTWLLTLRQRP